MNRLKEAYDRNKKWLLFSLMSTFLWGFAAHGYRFLHSSFSGDSLSEFSGAVSGNSWKIQLGRVIVPIYRAVLRTSLTLPWLEGLLSLLWIGLAVYLTIRIFQVESKGTAFLIAGIFTANITVSATAATFMHDYDCDMFALFCAVAAVYLWQNVRWGELPGSFFLALSLGLYQSYVLVAVVLVMFVCILALLNEESVPSVFTKGLRAIGMLLLGGILYYIIMQAVLMITGISLATGDAESHSLGSALSLSLRSIPSLVYYTYCDCIHRLLNVVSPYPELLVKGMTLVLSLIVMIALFAGLSNKQVSWPGKLLCIALTCLLPLAMNLLYIPTNGIIHDLMVYAIWLFYLLALLLAGWLGKRAKPQKGGKLLQTVSAALIFVLLYGNVQTSNVMYLKKDMEQNAFQSLMTRIVYRMEDCDEYEPGTTPVVFVGMLEQLNEVIPGFEEYRGITGMDSSAVATTNEDYRVRAYFQYVLNNPAEIADNDTWQTMCSDPRVAQMPYYPEDGCVSMVDGILVVKVGETE